MSKTLNFNRSFAQEKFESIISSPDIANFNKILSIITKKTREENEILIKKDENYVIIADTFDELEERETIISNKIKSLITDVLNVNANATKIILLTW